MSLSEGKALEPLSVSLSSSRNSCRQIHGTIRNFWVNISPINTEFGDEHVVVETINCLLA